MESAGEDANPYNIDYARERRLRMWFIGLIGGAFLLAALLVALAFILDVISEGAHPSVEPPPPPAQGVRTIGAKDGTTLLIT